MVKPLIVIGAGPKAVALAAKACVLRRHGWRVPPIRVIEMSELGAHWCGTYGYSDGRLLLCTSPEKDLGWPYATIFGPKVVEGMNEFSWRAFLTETNQLVSWMDNHRQTMHRLWVDYLQWAATKCRLSLVPGRVIGVDVANAAWRVRYVTSARRSRRVMSAQGIVVTGPGEPVHLDTQDLNDPCIYDGKSFWYPDTLSSFKKLENAKVAVIGAGDTAATIISTLLEYADKRKIQIDLIGHRKRLKPRREDYETNTYFSDPSDWRARRLDWRLAFIKSSDEGAVARDACKRIDEAAERGTVRFVRGHAIAARRVGQSIAVDRREGQTSIYDRVVVAIGFRSVAFERFFAKGTLSLHRGGTEKQRLRRLKRLVVDDLSLEGVNPRLHVPMLANVEQGPGFPNLTCLGLVADRILKSYATQKAP